MEAFALAKDIGYPARKVRLVADLVRGRPVEEAIEMLKLTPRAAAIPMRKTIQSAMHNLVNKHGGATDVEEMIVKIVQVDEGRTMYRIRPRAQGRAFRIRKRSSHIKVVVAMPDEDQK